MYSRWHVCNGIPFFDNLSVTCDTLTFSDMWYHDLQWHVIPWPSVTCDTLTFSDMWYHDLQWQSKLPSFHCMYTIDAFCFICLQIQDIMDKDSAAFWESLFSNKWEKMTANVEFYNTHNVTIGQWLQSFNFTSSGF